MDNIFELVICIDKLGYKKVTLEKNTINEIDKITTSYENSDELRNYYPEKISEFGYKYKEYMSNLSGKNRRKENGDITIIGTLSKERKRFMTLYKTHIDVFKYVIKDADFEQYLKTNFYNDYCLIQQVKPLNQIEFKETTSWLIRRIYKMYEEYAKGKNKLSPRTIYRHIKAVEQALEEYETLYDNIIVDNYRGIYDESNNEPTYPEETISYEVIEQEERRAYLKYDLIGQREEKGKTKIKSKKNQWGKAI